MPRRARRRGTAQRPPGGPGRHGQRKVIIRTIDVGGDKHRPAAAVEENPALPGAASASAVARPKLLDQVARALLRSNRWNAADCRCDGQRGRRTVPSVAASRAAHAVGDQERLPELVTRGTSVPARRSTWNTPTSFHRPNDLSQLPPWPWTVKPRRLGRPYRRLHPALRLTSRPPVLEHGHGRWVGA